MENEGSMGFFSSIRSEALQWCRGKSWRARSLLLLWFAYIFVRHLANPMYNSIIGPLDLCIHELGHMIFSFFGKFIYMAGGTFLQCLMPFIGIVNFYREKDYFAISLCFGWLSENFFDVARYAADARSMELPLATMFGNENVIHDWNYLLGTLGILQFDTVVAFFIKLLAVLSMLVCLFSGGWLIWQMKKES